VQQPQKGFFGRPNRFKEPGRGLDNLWQHILQINYARNLWLVRRTRLWLNRIRLIEIPVYKKSATTMAVFFITT